MPIMMGATGFGIKLSIACLLLGSAVAFSVSPAGYLKSAFALRAGAEGQEDGLSSLDDTELYPQPDLVSSGSLEVSGVHTVHYEEYGNPEGKPVLFVHGGPGGGTAPENARYFDPRSYRIILVDQRGCGKSTPFAALEENTTWDLVADFEKVREHLGVDTWMVFGGSWGSTLGLTYAMTHPDKTTELVLRGIFLLRQRELDFFYEGRGTNYLFPAEWEDYQAEIPTEELGEAGGSYIKAYGKRLRGELGEDKKRSAAKAWSVWEGSTSRLIPPCPAVGAHDLHAGLVEAAEEAGHSNRATLHVVTTGHSSFETDIIEKLVAATDSFRPSANGAAVKEANSAETAEAK